LHDLAFSKVCVYFKMLIAYRLCCRGPSFKNAFGSGHLESQ
jgi:hypothetical protein